MHIVTTISLLAISILTPASASAHTGSGVRNGFWHGLNHPFFDAGHLLGALTVISLTVIAIFFVCRYYRSKKTTAGYLKRAAVRTHHKQDDR